MSPIGGGDNIFAAPCKSVVFHFFPVSSLLVSLFYSSADSCRRSGPCALARTLSQNDARVTASLMLNPNVRSKPAAVGGRSTFLSLRFPSVFIWNQKRATNSPVFFYQFWAWIFFISILGMYKVQSTACKTYIRGCFGSGLLVSLEIICLLWKKNEWCLLLRVYAWCVLFSHIWQGSKTRTSYHKWSKCGNLEDQCSPFPLTSASKQGAANM